VEVLVDPVAGTLAHRPVDQVSGAFSLLVPDLDQGEWATLIHSTASPGAAEAGQIEIARLSLVDGETDYRNFALGPADGVIIGKTKIVDNGPAAARWNMVILSEGFRDDQLEDFASVAQAIVDEMFDTPPFDQLQTGINVYRIDVASIESRSEE